MPRRAADGPEIRMGALRVLIVEDDVIYAEAVKCVLERESHRVLGIAADAVAAHALVRAGRPDLALIDIGLRDGPTGVEIGRRLALDGVSVLFLTGRPDRVPRDLVGALGVLAKPAGDARLLRAVHAVAAMIRRDDAAGTRPNVLT